MKKHARRSISTTMVLAFTALIVAVTLAVVTRSYAYTREQLQDTATEYTGQLISQVNAEIDMYVGYIKDLSDMVVDNTAVTAYLTSFRSGFETSWSDRVSQLLSGIAEIRQEITTIALLPLEGDAIFGNPSKTLNRYADYQASSWYLGALEAGGKVYISSSHVENLVEGEYPWVVSFSRAVLGSEGELLGVLLVDLNYEIIDEICANIQLGNRGYIFLVDSASELLWHPKQNLIYANLMQENVSDVMAQPPGVIQSSTESGQKLYISRKSHATGWTAVGVAYPEELLQHQDRMFRQYLLIGAVGAGVAFLLAILISRAITNPLRRLALTMKALEQGDFSVRSGVRSNNEVGQLSDSFNHMIATTQALMAQQLRDQEQKRQSEWKLLQAQIKPHFIYNTLDSIIWMSHAGRNEEVVEMTSALAQLLRNSIGSGKEIITLGEELAHIESYLAIQKLRYRDKLQFELDIDPQTTSCLLPKLVLQPLVENAIYHGIRLKESSGTILVASMFDEDKLLVTVEDDGAGMNEEQLAHIYDEKESDDASSKIGIYNVNERLRIYFGLEAGLKFFSEPEKGTTAMLILPKLWEEEGGVHHETED